MLKCFLYVVRKYIFQYKGVLEFNGETYIYGEAFAYPERDKMAYASGWAMERVPVMPPQIAPPPLFTAL